MPFLRRFPVAFAVVLPLIACKDGTPADVAHAPSDSHGAATGEGPKDKHEKGKHGDKAEKDGDNESPAAERHTAALGHAHTVPFVWEVAREDGLAVTRGFMRVLFTDNASYVKAHDAAFFHPFEKAQTPRATVISCADSRVHTQAFDAHPENDVFAIRNIGNQIQNSEGSVEYGIHHLKTKVLVVLGHTGCGAVKARMGDISKESPAIRRELELLNAPKADAQDDKAWADAVVANVNDQVAFATLKFDAELDSGDLTIVGAVYDLKNDLGRGQGRITVVNVNGTTEPKRLVAFERAVTGLAPLPEEPDRGATTVAAHHRP